MRCPVMLCCCLRGKVAAAIAAAIGSAPCPAPGAYNGCLARFPHSKAIEQTVPHKCFCAREVADLAHLNKGDTYRAACVANRRPQDCSRKDSALPRLSYWGKQRTRRLKEGRILACDALPSFLPGFDHATRRKSLTSTR